MKGWDEKAVVRASLHQKSAVQKTSLKKSKYNNKKVVVDGKKFDSIKESKRFTDVLFPAFKCGEITELECQPKYDMIVNGVKICERGYKPDFRYKNKKGELVVEDVKGYKKEAAYKIFKMKKQLMKAIYNIDVVEI